MVQVLVHRNRFGAAAVYLRPADGTVPPAAYTAMPDNLHARSVAPVTARGPKLSWAAFCKLLESRARNGEQHWTVEDVPDGLSAHDALNYVRQEDAGSLAA